jgi:hypothetical protein
MCCAHPYFTSSFACTRADDVRARTSIRTGTGFRVHHRRTAAGHLVVMCRW